MKWLGQLLTNGSAGDSLGKASADVDGVTVPLALKVREESDRLCVFYNGAVDRRLAPDGIVFQRSSWAEEVQANCLFVADPALLRRPHASIGWGQLNSELWLPDAMAEISVTVGEALGVRASRRLHFGSSAGGFQALTCSAADAGSSALVNNPQTDWLRYDPQGPGDAILRDVFGGARREHVLESKPWRARVWEWFDRRECIPDFTYVVNGASFDDVEVQLAPLLRALGSMHHRFPDAQWTVHRYFDSTVGHSPLAKKPALGSINRALASL